MPAPQGRTPGARLHALKDRLDDVAYRYDDAERDLDARRALNDELEAIADAVRTIPRGRGFK
jgi:hypothetical protein